MRADTVGVTLAVAGLTLAASSALLAKSTPLTALGASTALVGVVLWSIHRGQAMMPVEAAELLMEASLGNISAILEEFGVREAPKAVYLPSSLCPGGPRALIPLKSSTPERVKVLEKRVIAKYGPGEEDIGLLVLTPGSIAASRAELEPTAESLESALSSVVSSLGLADSAKVAEAQGHIRVEVSNERVRLRETWASRALGSLMASIAASLAAEAYRAPVTVEHEEQRGRSRTILLKVHLKQPFSTKPAEA